MVGQELGPDAKDLPRRRSAQRRCLKVYQIGRSQGISKRSIDVKLADYNLYIPICIYMCLVHSSPFTTHHLPFNRKLFGILLKLSELQT